MNMNMPNVTAEEYVKQHSGSSVASQLIIISLIMSSIEIQYFSVYYLAADIGGNLFTNVILLSIGASVSGVVSGYLINVYSDVRVFQSFALCTGIFNLIFYFVSDAILKYICFILTAFGAAAQFCVIFIIVELRIPPENIGAAIAIVLTIGNVAAAISPFVG